MKKFLVLLFLICLPVFATNTLQEKYENNSHETFVAMNLINDDFNGYYNKGKSFYGYLLYSCEEYAKQNKKLDLQYINKIISNWESAYATQSIDNLHYIQINDKDYVKLQEDTKRFVSMYNSIIKNK